jgi:arylsulfatase
MRPNVVLILADDLGFSDIGCYGGEIRTPNLDRLGRDGVRLSQFYNSARCSPSRASLLTGLHPHQTGLGVLTNDDRPYGYPGNLSERCVTLAESLRDVGYATCLTGKWHLASEMRQPNAAWPTQRGFDHFYGTLTGCGSYFAPGTLTRGETNIEQEALDDGGFYYTDAITDEAVAFLARQRVEAPFVLYVAYTAPHWPLHAPEADIAAYDGMYEPGWDALREARLRALREEGILADADRLSPRDSTEPAWENAAHQRWQTRRMQAYAAQVTRMDRGVGRIVSTLASKGILDDTLVIFLSDNGASDESLPKVDPERFRLRTDILRTRTRDGRQVRIGNEPEIDPGAEDTYASYGRAWANLSNTPFRYYKQWVHEGGIATPFIVHWPNGRIAQGSVLRTAFQLTDVLPTVLDACGARYPDSRGGEALPRCEGRSMLPTLRGDSTSDGALFWEHTGNAAARHGQWKLVRQYDRPWELYDLEGDRSELLDLAASQPALVRELGSEWQRWADRVGVIPWQATLDLYRQRGLADEEAAG